MLCRVSDLPVSCSIGNTNTNFPLVIGVVNVPHEGQLEPTSMPIQQQERQRTSLRAREEIERVHAFEHSLQEFGRDASFGAAADVRGDDCAAEVANWPTRISFARAIVASDTVVSFYHRCADVDAKLQFLRHLAGCENDRAHHRFSRRGGEANDSKVRLGCCPSHLCCLSFCFE